MLREPEVKAGVQCRTYRLESAVGRDTAVVEPDRTICAPLESLNVLEVCRRSSLIASWQGAGRNEACMIVLDRAAENGIEAGDERPKQTAGGGTDNAANAHAGTAGAERRAASTRPHLCAESAHAAARSILHDAEWNAKNLSTRLGPEDVGVRDVQVIAGNGDVEVVLESERDRVIQGNVELPIMQQLVNARGIRKIR